MLWSRNLQSSRLIEIWVGNAKKPFLVPHNLLISQAPEYFAKALDPNTFSEGKARRIDFPEDDVESWRVFLFWLFNRELPNFPIDVETAHDRGGSKLFVRCWALGDRYAVPAFQDEIMLALMDMLKNFTVNWPPVKLAFDITAPNSQLRRIMAEEAGENMHRGLWKDEDFKKLDGVDFTYEFIKAPKGSKTKGNERCNRFKRQKGEGGKFTYLWKSYMVGEGPKKHRIVGDTM
ncbi:hypothetical protein BDY17DRAFT_25464 [Neohortaea acidophila]|uniref:BTB domain-containing protein n=1 Tax=Neohortaea acidophila TaxID=245834 RepID=A0A6A6Q7C2_9PEZI|nr:uncharacterized protein BDY17DRAFT_25464 [Neohortaea acidophila]KAF2488205.1 hypothetical protein BDY17DRAFT_25464 [Neohortaea acidophila]